MANKQVCQVTSSLGGKLISVLSTPLRASVLVVFLLTKCFLQLLPHLTPPSAQNRIASQKMYLFYLAPELVQLIFNELVLSREFVRVMRLRLVSRTFQIC